MYHSGGRPLETSFKLASKITLTSYFLQTYHFTITNFKNYQMGKTPIMSGYPYIAGGKKHLLSFSCISCFMFFSLRIKRSHSSKEGQRWRKFVNSDTVWYPLNSLCTTAWKGLNSFTHEQCFGLELNSLEKKLNISW